MQAAATASVTAAAAVAVTAGTGRRLGRRWRERRHYRPRCSSARIQARVSRRAGHSTSMLQPSSSRSRMLRCPSPCRPRLWPRPPHPAPRPLQPSPATNSIRPSRFARLHAARQSTRSPQTSHCSSQTCACHLPSADPSALPEPTSFQWKAARRAAHAARCSRLARLRRTTLCASHPSSAATRSASRMGCRETDCIAASSPLPSAPSPSAPFPCARPRCGLPRPAGPTPFALLDSAAIPASSLPAPAIPTCLPCTASSMSASSICTSLAQFVAATRRPFRPSMVQPPFPRERV
jgi:hypothetical protein